MKKKCFVCCASKVTKHHVYPRRYVKHTKETSIIQCLCEGCHNRYEKAARRHEKKLIKTLKLNKRIIVLKIWHSVQSSLKSQNHFNAKIGIEELNKKLHKKYKVNLSIRRIALLENKSIVQIEPHYLLVRRKINWKEEWCSHFNRWVKNFKKGTKLASSSGQSVSHTGSAETSQ